MMVMLMRVSVREAIDAQLMVMVMMMDALLLWCSANVFVFVFCTQFILLSLSMKRRAARDEVTAELRVGMNE